MDFKQIKQKIISIKKTSSTSHYKVSVAALCDVMLELTKEMEKIHNPPLVKLTQRPDPNPDIKTGPQRKRPKPMEFERPDHNDPHNTKNYGSNNPSKNIIENCEMDDTKGDGIQTSKKPDSEHPFRPENQS